MNSKSTKFSLMAALMLLSSGSYCFAEPASGGITEAAGIVVGTVPSIYNSNSEAGRIDIAKDNTHEAEDNLDIGDTVTLSWQFRDNEGDIDNTAPTIAWSCISPIDSSVHPRQEGGASYVIQPGDKGCIISVKVTPTSLTGIPNTNAELEITDISAYDDRDNIPSGIVNPHSMYISQYTVAPNTTQSKVVSKDSLLRTVWNGAQIQLKTNNTESQVDWTSSDDSIATITEDGLVTFKTKGKVTFTATREDISDSITFDPQQFYIFATTTMDWSTAKSWCEGQGYKQPTVNQLSVGKDLREIPSNALWQEWGDLEEQGAQYVGVVFWSSEQTGTTGNYRYVYINDGHSSSNRGTVPEGVACVK